MKPLITNEMRAAGAEAIEELDGVGSLEEKAVAAYTAMRAAEPELSPAWTSFLANLIQSAKEFPLRPGTPD